MANTSAVYARIDSTLKTNAEEILSQMGISPSTAIQMLYSQVVLTRAFPFKPELPQSKPKALSEMTKEEIDAELSKGMASVKSGKVYSIDELDDLFSKEFDL